jgi:hypothetical protein
MQGGFCLLAFQRRLGAIGRGISKNMTSRLPRAAGLVNATTIVAVIADDEWTLGVFFFSLRLLKYSSKVA